ncbi:hypothetical protein FQN54_003400 [Arachnomyces sp. PD_36]|nr:hypothetical protein FQN54_003400 [Arachnomyces sp. PD_36]
MSTSSKHSKGGKPSSGPETILVKALTAKDVAYQPLIRYYDKGERHVKSSSLHGLWFADDVELWDSFEDEAALAFTTIPWDNHPSILAYGPPEDENVSAPALYSTEHYICGEELSISGRWVQHALHPMCAVGKGLGFETVFGDWKATSQNKVSFIQTGKVDPTTGRFTSAAENTSSEITSSTPEADQVKKRNRKELILDYALMVEDNGAPRAVGEAKTPWNHGFDDMYASLKDTPDKLVIRRPLGQIGNYMIELQLKYGFLTNYDQTFFLKREVVEGRETLYCSRPIASNASQSKGDPISVRQGLLFLQSSARGDAWRAEKISDQSIIKKRKDETVKETTGRVVDAITKSKVKGVPKGEEPDESPEVEASGVSGSEIGELEDRVSNLNMRVTRSKSSKSIKFSEPPEAPESSKRNPRK